MRAVTVGLLLTLAVACTSPVEVSDDALRVRRVPAGLELLNLSRTPLSYIVIVNDVSPPIDWIPCAGPACPTVAAHATVFVPDSAMVGFTQNARVARVYWWPAVPDSVSHAPWDSVHQLVTPL